MVIKGFFDYRLTSKVYKMQKTLKIKEEMSSESEEDGEGEGDKSEDSAEDKQHRIRVDSMLYKRASFIR